MYTLRRVLKGSGFENNKALGASYSLVSREQKTGGEFNKAMAVYFGKEIGDKLSDEQIYEGNNIHAFVSDENGRLTPLYKNDSYYVMTDSGKTFSNLTFK